MIIWLNFFLFLQTKSSFCCLFAWSQLDSSAIPVSISAVSLTSRLTWQNVNSKRRLQRIENVQEGKRHQKKETSSCFCLCPFCFWGVVSNSWILNDIGRNFLLGNRKKIAKCLMRTFTYRSTFLYDLQYECSMQVWLHERQINNQLFNFTFCTKTWFRSRLQKYYSLLSTHRNISTDGFCKILKILHHALILTCPM